MGIFSTSSPFDSHVEKATSEKNTTDDWAQIMDVCDRVKAQPNATKDCLKSIIKRLSNDNPRVALQSITLLDACVNNCGRKFLLEVASREFEQDLYKVITSSKTHTKVSNNLKESLKKWAEGDFKSDPELGLIPALFSKLMKEGHDFEANDESPKKTKLSSDPNVVNSAEEEEDIAKAIQLSLLDSGTNTYKGTASNAASSSIYADLSSTLSSDSPVAFPSIPSEPPKDPRKVRALYDFEAAEDNELSFKAGELIVILDDTDANWWKGSNHRGDGLFPANFVTTELEDDQSSRVNESGSSKRVSFNESVEVAELSSRGADELGDGPVEEVSVDEGKIDRVLHLLHEADPTGERPDDADLSYLEEQVNLMAPNIDAELECIDRKHAQLARLSSDLVEALGLYHQLMKEMPTSASAAPFFAYKAMPPGSTAFPPTVGLAAQYPGPGQPHAHPHSLQGMYGGKPAEDMRGGHPMSSYNMESGHDQMNALPSSAAAQHFPHGYPIATSGPGSLQTYGQYPGANFGSEYVGAATVPGAVPIQGNESYAPQPIMNQMGGSRSQSQAYPAHVAPMAVPTPQSQANPVLASAQDGVGGPPVHGQLPHPDSQPAPVTGPSGNLTYYVQPTQIPQVQQQPLL